MTEEEESSDYYRWHIVVEIIQLVFDIGDLESDCTWDTVILIPKDGGAYHIIGLVEVI